MQLSKNNPASNNLIAPIQRSVYERIAKIQSHKKDLLSQTQKVIHRQKQRIQMIEQKSHKQIVTHPYNNGHWVNLAGFINGPDDRTLDDIQKRREERQKIRLEMQAKQQESAKIPQDHSQNTEQIQNQGKSQKSKINWKLMRQLRRKQVQQNKARIEKIESNKRQKMNKYHKY